MTPSNKLRTNTAAHAETPIVRFRRLVGFNLLDTSKIHLLQLQKDFVSSAL